MKEIGDLLRFAREDKGIEISDVAKELKVQEKYVIMLEAGEIDGFDGQVYITGFLKSYANWLGLDGKEILSEVRSSDNLRLPKSFAPESQAFFYSIDNLVQPSFKTIFISVLLVCLIFYFIPNENHSDFFENDEEVAGEKYFVLKAKNNTNVKIYDIMGNLDFILSVKKGEEYFFPPHKYLLEGGVVNPIEIYLVDEGKKILQGSVDDNPFLKKY